MIKKILFSALAMVAFAGGAMASGTEVNEKTTYTYIESAESTSKVCVVNVYNSKGKLVNKIYIYDVPENVACNSQAVSDRAIQIHRNTLTLTPSL